MLARLREWARLLKRDVIAIYLAAGDPRVPWHAKVLAAAIAAYALSPIDLIPDFIPVLGLLDELILLPLGIALVVRMIPPPVMAELRVAADAATARPQSHIGAIVIIAIWTALTALACWVAYRLLA
jgi:uncharacterized membrane protein YkvA (DUF1232 family)